MLASWLGSMDISDNIRDGRQQGKHDEDDHTVASVGGCFCLREKLHAIHEPRNSNSDEQLKPEREDANGKILENRCHH